MSNQAQASTPTPNDLAQPSSAVGSRTIPLTRAEIRAHSLDKANIILNRSPLDKGPMIAVFVLSLILMSYMSTRFPVTVQQINLGTLFGYSLSFGLPLFGIIPVVLLCFIAHDLCNYLYILTPDYLLEIDGLWSLKLCTTRLEYLHVRGVELDKSFYQRFFNIGDLRIGSDVHTRDTEILLKGIAKPHDIKDVIQERRKEIVGKLSTGTLYVHDRV